MSDLFKYTPQDNKGVMFFSTGTPKGVRLLFDMGINQVLVSYHYVKKARAAFEYSVFPELFKDKNNLLMVDSGGSTYIVMFFEEKTTPEMFKEDFWIPLIEDYVNWLYKFKEYIFVAANFDMEMYVGNAVVDKWNRKYFKPLEKHMNIVYVAHEDVYGENKDQTGIIRIKEYLSEHDYVGISGVRTMVAQHRKIFELSKIYKKRVHGFGWTSLPTLKSSPFFSVDSTTWLGGVKYGTSYNYDGKNFRVLDYHKKYTRKSDKFLCLDNKISFEKLMDEEEDAVNRYNLVGWKGARKEYLKVCNLQLWNKNVSYYDRR